MESKNFTYDLDNRLIEMVKKHPYLYKSTERKFRDNVLREQVWKEISKSMSRTVSECKTRWRTMRDSYRKNKNKAKLLHGAPSRSKYDDENLRFLDDVPPKRRRKSTVKAKRDHAFEDGPVIVGSTSLALGGEDQMVTMEEEGSAATQILEAVNDSMDVRLTLYRAAASPPQHAASGSPEGDPVVLPASSTAAVEGWVALEDIRNDINERFQALEERLVSDKRSVRAENPVEIFFRSMASTVMTFSPRLIAEAKVQVCQIISELELRNVSEDSCGRK